MITENKIKGLEIWTAAPGGRLRVVRILRNGIPIASTLDQQRHHRLLSELNALVRRSQLELVSDEVAP